MDDFSLDGKVALVTGGAMGLGKAITEHLLQQGCRVAFADLNATAGLATAEELRGKFDFDRVVFIKCDITDDQAFEDCFLRVKKTFGRLDIVVNNAGFAGEARWRKIFEVNTMAVYFGTLLALKYMGKDRGSDGGHVINIASIAGLVACPAIPAYNASKYGVIGLTRAFGSDLYYSRTGVKVSCLCPEPIETNLWQSISEFCQEIEVSTPYITEHYSRGLQKPENVAKGVTKLIQDGINGSALLSLYEEGLVYHEFAGVK